MLKAALKTLPSQVSIPQAVSTIAIQKFQHMLTFGQRFNTASGKYYCNLEIRTFLSAALSFNTASGKYYCNLQKLLKTKGLVNGFNTASGKYYCNDGRFFTSTSITGVFQYRKR